MKKQKMKLALMVAAMGAAVQSQAAIETYDINFAGGGYSASGQIYVENGYATSGFLDVTAGADLGTYALVSRTSSLINGVRLTVRIAGAHDQIFDDAVSLNSNPFLTGDGLEFANDHSIGFNLWGNNPGSYSLFDASQNTYNIVAGIANLAAVPEPETTTKYAGLSALGLVGLVSIRRKFLTVG